MIISLKTIVGSLRFAAATQQQPIASESRPQEAGFIARSEFKVFSLKDGLCVFESGRGRKDPNDGVREITGL